MDNPSGRGLTSRMQNKLKELPPLLAVAIPIIGVVPGVLLWVIWFFGENFGFVILPVIAMVSIVSLAMTIVIMFKPLRGKYKLLVAVVNLSFFVYFGVWICLSK